MAAACATTCQVALQKYGEKILNAMCEEWVLNRTGSDSRAPPWNEHSALLQNPAMSRQHVFSKTVLLARAAVSLPQLLRPETALGREADPRLRVSHFG